MVLTEGLKRAGHDLTRDKLRLALTSMRHLALGDYVLGYSNAAPFIASRYVGPAMLDANGRPMG